MKKPTFLKPLAAWRKAHRYPLQVAALLVGIATPFALFAALSAGQVALAGALFGVLALGLALTWWAG